MNPSEVWLAIGIPAFLLSWYLMYRGIHRLVLFGGKVDVTVREKFLAWALMSFDIMCFLLFGMSTFVGLISANDDREWTVYARVGILFQFALFLCELLFTIFTEMAKRHPKVIEKL